MRFGAGAHLEPLVAAVPGTSRCDGDPLAAFEVGTSNFDGSGFRGPTVGPS
jgi:hypothetical protein